MNRQLKLALCLLNRASYKVNIKKVWILSYLKIWQDCSIDFDAFNRQDICTKVASAARPEYLALTQTVGQN